MQLSDSLSRRLREMYDAAAKEDKLSIVPSLFGIVYAEQIRNCGSSPNDLVEMAGIPASYSTEIYKGMRLSEYVEPKVSRDADERSPQPYRPNTYKKRAAVA